MGSYLYAVIDKELKFMSEIVRDLERKLRESTNSNFDISITTFPGQYGLLVTLPSSLRDDSKCPQEYYNFGGREVPLSVVYN